MRKAPTGNRAARGPRAGPGICALALAAAVSLAPAGARAAGFEDGAAAYARGDYAAALELWRPLAEAGQARAQYNLGIMTVRGLGGAPDPAAAALWLLAAARQGHGAAQLTLGGMYALGEGVPRDLVKSYVWLDRAVESLPAGRDRAEALRRRELIKAEMGQLRFEESLRVAVVPAGPEGAPGTGEMPRFTPLPPLPSVAALPAEAEAAEASAVARDAAKARPLVTAAGPPEAAPPDAAASDSGPIDGVLGEGTPGEGAPDAAKTAKDERAAAPFTLGFGDLFGGDDGRQKAETAAAARPGGAAETGTAGPGEAGRGTAAPAGAGLAAQAAAVQAAPVAVRAGRHGTFARLVFDWPEPVHYAARLEGGRLLVFFSEAGDFALGAVRRQIGDYLGPAEVSADRTAVGFALAQALEIKAFTLDSRIVIDLTPTP